MSTLPQAGIYQIKHASTGNWLTMSSSSSIVGSPTNTGKKSQWRLSPASGIYGGYHVTNLEGDRYLNYNASNNHMIMFGTGIWCLEDAGVAGQYYFHMQWNHYVGIMSAAKVARCRRIADEKWIFQFVGPLDKVLPAPTLHRNIHYPFAPGHYVIRNVGTDTVMHVEYGSGDGAVVGHQANGSKDQKVSTFRVIPFQNFDAKRDCAVVCCPDGNWNCYGHQDSWWRHDGRYRFTQDAALGIYKSLDPDYMLIITPADKGFWISPAAYPFNVFDVAGANPADGTEIVLWPRTGEEHQKWYFEPA
ncbi:hypothetical protein RHS01_08962 [Rhizoctonia solani]|uniref:Ricin B lectin domain-containing protein n=1 Tax=Rhizoctonia solani TaxID=456999 RepID=A0A8H7I4G9_9AGAM|nr:hypothetical protein RHS01_08962 [Rhizoctonia solani]